MISNIIAVLIILFTIGYAFRFDKAIVPFFKRLFYIFYKRGALRRKYKNKKIGDLPRSKRRKIYRELNVPSFSQQTRQRLNQEQADKVIDKFIDKNLKYKNDVAV
jgi:hypothetical protein